MLLPTNQDFWLRSAIERLQGEADVTAEKSLLLLLWYAQTSAADKTIAEFSVDATKPGPLRHTQVNYFSETRSSHGINLGMQLARPRNPCGRPDGNV